MPTRGSPSASSCTSGRSASQSMSLRASATSAFGSLSPIFPVDLPKPRAVQVRTAYPLSASFSACCRRSALLLPKPWASITASRRPSPPAVKYEVSIRTPSTVLRIWSCRFTPPPLSSAAEAEPAGTSRAARTPAEARAARHLGGPCLLRRMDPRYGRPKGAPCPLQGDPDVLREAYTRVPRTASVVGPAHDAALAPAGHPPSSQRCRTPHPSAPCSTLRSTPPAPSTSSNVRGITSSSRTPPANLWASSRAGRPPTPTKTPKCSSMDGESPPHVGVRVRGARGRRQAVSGHPSTRSSGHCLCHLSAFVSYTSRGASTGLGRRTRLKMSARPCGA